ncbi:MAG: glycosyltransferase family 4 protein [Candidatus Bathyarchaeota archaeon]|nr:glycosyltransferase family 4 protein [Candidatus Bathyarchaeota archaeon]
MDRFRLAVFNTQPPHLYFGGVERRIMETAMRLCTEVEVTIYCGTKAGFRVATSVDGVNIVPLHSTDKVYPLDNWCFNKSLTKEANKIKADVYEGHAVSGYGFPRKLKEQGGNKPFVHVVHGVLADEYEQAKKRGHQSIRGKIVNYFMHYLANLEEQTAKNASLIVTISKYSLQKIQQYYDIDPSKVRIVPNGVDTEKFKPAPDGKAARNLFGIGQEPCVLFVGSLIARKGLPFLVEAAKKIVKEKASTKFLIVGEGPLKEALTTTLSKENLLGNFKFLGNLKEETLPAIYNCADVFVLPSIQEGQGIVLLEAQASGLPVVAFDVGGVNEAVRNGETGLLVERGKTDELADAMLKMLTDSALRQRMGANGRRFVADNFTWDLCAQRMLQVYHEAMSEQH